MKKVLTLVVCLMLGILYSLQITQAANVRGPEVFQAGSLTVDGLVGSLDIVVRDVPTVEVMLEGPHASLSRYDVRVDKGSLQITLKKVEDKIKPIKAIVVLPEKTPVHIKDLVGKAVIGDLNATLALNDIVGNVLVGNLSHAVVNTNGRADIKIGDIAKDLKIESKGDIRLTANKTCHASIHTDGLGQVVIGEIDGDLAIDMLGNSSVKILGGRAHKMNVSMVGDGIVHFEGTTKDPDLKMVGAGKLFIKELKGEAKLTKADHSKVQFGNRPEEDKK